MTHRDAPGRHYAGSALARGIASLLKKSVLRNNHGENYGHPLKFYFHITYRQVFSAFKRTSLALKKNISSFG
jgi:hypothetical protein